MSVNTLWCNGGELGSAASAYSTVADQRDVSLVSKPSMKIELSLAAILMTFASRVTAVCASALPSSLAPELRDDNHEESAHSRCPAVEACSE